jgi:hypothetical protein
MTTKREWREYYGAFGLMDEERWYYYKHAL